MCEGPENAKNCPQDCAILNSESSDEESNAQQVSGSDLAKSVEITVTTSTTQQNGYGMTVTGVINLDLDFPAEGGEAILPMGSVRITDYAWEEIPGCEVKIPEGLVGSTQSISFEKVEYTPGGFMIFSAPVQYEPVNVEVVLNCAITGSVSVTEMPFYKVFGLFNEKYTTLSFKPEETFNNTFPWGTNDAWSSNVVIVVK